MINSRFLIIISLALAYNLRGFSQQAATKLTDMLVLGNTSSEKEHRFEGAESKSITGGLNEPARILLPLPEAGWQGGKLSFTIKVDPGKQNYITTRFWGSDINHNRLYFVCGDKQVGSRHLGDIDMLDIGSDAPQYNERFFYTTLPLPLSLTKGKQELQLDIRSQGLIWGYGQTWDQYQKNMDGPSRGIYNVYTHTNPTFIPPADEKQGVAPIASLRKSPGPEVLDKLKNRVNTEIDKLKKLPSPLNQVQMQFLAKSYRVKWSDGYKSKEVVFQVQNGLDELYKAYKLNPRLALSDPSTPNPDWFGFGPAAQALHLLFDELKPKLDDRIDDGLGNSISRREALTDMFLTSRTLNQKSRRQYSNQTMIKDLYGIYYCNKGLQRINPGKAIPEKEVLRYLYEAVGLQPWLGSDGDNGPTRPQGDNYWQLTRKGLTKELGFVGNYGEVLDWVTEIYEATRPGPGQPGDAQIGAQVVRIAQARACFRYPMIDDENYKAMRQEVIVGWRDVHYPGDVTYAQRASWDGNPLQVASAVTDARLTGYAQQMVADNQFFSSVDQRMNDKGFRVTAGLLFIPDQYEWLKAQPPSAYKLPMSADQPDFVFSDEDDGVIAIKNGQEIFYASLYWRARNAINHLARVHDVLPGYDRIATVYVDEKFDSSGLLYTVPDNTNMLFGNGGVKYPDGLHLANAGEQEPIAKIPAGIPYTAGQENPYAGRADYYQLQYGHYIIAMNAAANKTFELKVPEAFMNARELVTGKIITGQQVKVPAQSTVVLYKQ